MLLLVTLRCRVLAVAGGVIPLHRVSVNRRQVITASAYPAENENQYLVSTLL